MSHPNLRRWYIVLLIAAIVLALALHFAGPLLGSMVRADTRRFLEMQFRSRLTFDDFQVAVFPHIQGTMTGIVLRLRDNPDLPPLVEIRKMTIRANLLALLLPKPHVSLVQLEGVHLRIPPHMPGAPPLIPPTGENLGAKYPVIISRVEAQGLTLETLRSDPAKPSRVFEIHTLILTDAGFDRPSDFHAELTNPVPRGEIVATGLFGPWKALEPGETPVKAHFTFDRADLGTIKGIQGILSSHGTFEGPLDYLQVDGETDTPDFALRTASHPVTLHTTYSAIVDGTNGNTYLNKVTANFASTEIVCSGQVVGVPGEKGRHIELSAVSENARIEDLLRLVVKSGQPLMTGNVSLKTKILIPPGNEGASGDVEDRMSLDGAFDVVKALFTNPQTQAKVDSLSRKALGQPQNEEIDRQVSGLKGAFTMSDAVISFSDLSFSVEGAAIRLHGTYNVDSGALDFRGRLLLQAKLLQTTTGAKSFFLKILDPFFKGKNSGTDLPIKITGTKEKPAFGLDFGDPKNPKQ